MCELKKLKQKQKSVVSTLYFLLTSQSSELCHIAIPSCERILKQWIDVAAPKNRVLED